MTGEDSPRNARMKQTPAIEIGEGGQFLGSCRSGRYFLTGFFLNIASMRWVTMKPPKMFTDARDHGDKAENLRGAQRPATDRPPAARRR